MNVSQMILQQSQALLLQFSVDYIPQRVTCNNAQLLEDNCGTAPKCYVRLDKTHFVKSLANSRVLIMSTNERKAFI